MSEETLLEFPCDFPIKMMGRDTPEFRAMVREVEKPRAPAAMPSFTIAAISRMSSGVADSFFAPRSPIT